MPNLGAIGSNAIFCEGGDLTGPQAPISATPEDNEIYSSKMERKRCKEYLAIILAVKEALSDFLGSCSSLKKANTGSRLKT